MQPDDTKKEAPLGVLLIAIYWIFIGVYFLAQTSTSNSNNVFLVIPTLIGTFFIFLGWTLILLKTWAYYVALVIAIIGIFPGLIFIPTLIFSLFYMGLYSTRYQSTSIPALILIPYIPMAWYLYKNKSIFVKEPDQIPKIYCPNCGRSIPNDSRRCPYCAKKLDELVVRETTDPDLNWEERLDKVLKNEEKSAK